MKKMGIWFVCLAVLMTSLLASCAPQTSLTETMETMEGNMGIESATQEKGGGRSKNFLGVSKKVLSKGTGQDILFFGSSVK